MVDTTVFIFYMKNYLYYDYQKDRSMKDLTCKNCGCPREVGRRLCSKCNSDRIRNYPRYTWTKNCEACSCLYEAHRKEQRICSLCFADSQKIRAENIATNNYVSTNIPGLHQHRKLAKEVLGRELSTHEVIHHVDENPKNNSLDNLMLMTRTTHGKLHKFLDYQRVIVEKSMTDNQGNCWNNLRVPMTTAWLETSNAKVIKLSEIGQSAAEPLNVKDA